MPTKRQTWQILLALLPGALLLLLVFLWLSLGFEKGTPAPQPSVLLGLIAVLGLLALTLGFWMWTQILRPLEKLVAGTQKLVASAPDPPQKLEIPQASELRILAECLNHMAVQLADQTQAARQHEREQESLLGSLQEGVIVIDSRSRVRQVNKAATHLIGFEEQQVVGRLISECLPSQILQQFVSTLLSGSESAQVEMILGSRQQRNVRIQGNELLDTYGRKVGVVLVLSDTTRLRALEKLESGFLANVAHELKTPLTAIKGFAETLLDGALQDQEESERFVRIIAQQSDRLDHLTGRLLELSRLEGNQSVREAEREWHSIPELLERSVSFCSQESSDNSIRMAVECPPDLVARINVSLMEHAVRNLLENAIKYSSPGGEVSIQAGAEHHEVFLSVQDRGLGIDPIHHAQIFERFYRVDPRRKSQGSGLGLAIVKRIVEAHGGRIELRSEPDRGSTFTIRLPGY